MRIRQSLGSLDLVYLKTISLLEYSTWFHAYDFTWSHVITCNKRSYVSILHVANVHMWFFYIFMIFTRSSFTYKCISHVLDFCFGYVHMWFTCVRFWNNFTHSNLLWEIWHEGFSEGSITTISNHRFKARSVVHHFNLANAPRFYSSRRNILQVTVWYNFN